MSDDDRTMGEVCDELEALGSKAYIDCHGKVWRLQYLGEVQLEAPPAGVFRPFPGLETQPQEDT